MNQPNTITLRKRKTNNIIEIGSVLLLMLLTKATADYFGILGAGSIGIWSGIALGTFFLKKEDMSWKNLGLQLPKGGKDWMNQIGIALAAMVGIFLLMGLVLDPVLQSLGIEKGANEADRFQFFLGEPALFIAYLVVVVWIGAALGEELLFRGYLLNKLVSLFGHSKFGWTLSILIQAAIFGSLHIYQGWSGVITSGIIGLVFSMIYLISKKRLFTVVLTHALINTVTLMAFYLADGQV